MPTATKSRRRASKPKADRVDTYQRVTDLIVAQLEKGASGKNWSAPWRAITDGPRNVASKKPYRGINTLLLAVEAMEHGYDVPLWGTYRQWEAKGGQVRRGEKAATAVLWKPFEKRVENERGEIEKEKRLLIRAFAVFNVAQVDGYEPPTTAPVHTDERVPEADAVIEETGAAINYGGDRAYYTPAADRIALPRFEHFTSANGFYSTAFHELTHWTGHPDRCNRDLNGRFGQEQYAAEELIAELGSAFVMASLGLESEPRTDHADYLASWLTLLKHDNRAIFTAASAAQRATDFIVGVDVDDEDDDEEVAA